MRHHHSMPQSANKASHQHKRHVNTSMRTHSSNINYKRNQTGKKRFSPTTIFLFSLMVILLTFGIYFTFDIFTSTGGAQTNTETIEYNSSHIENTVALILNTPEDSVKKTVVDIDMSNTKQEIEETYLKKDKEPSTLDKLKEMER